MLNADLDQAFYDKAAFYDVELVSFAQTTDAEYHPQTQRYFDYQTILADVEAREVLLTDVRDVIFQGNPFGKADGKVSAAAEDWRIAQCPFNTDWLRRLYSDEIASKCASKWISCSGTTIGPLAEMRRYVDLVCGEILAHSDVAAEGAVDQGYHNFIVHEMQPSFIRLDEDDRIVNTVGYADPLNLEMENTAVRSRGSAFVSPVLHQWDRHASLVDYIRNMYCS